MENKELIIEAINDSSRFTPTEKKILNIFIELEDNELVYISPMEICKMLKITKAWIYINLKNLERKNFIERFPKILTEKGISHYKLEQNNINKILENFIKKKSLYK